MEKINYEELEKLGKEHGFSFVCPLDCDTIQLTIICVPNVGIGRCKSK